jgi:hypothetical protein
VVYSPIPVIIKKLGYFGALTPPAGCVDKAKGFLFRGCDSPNSLPAPLESVVTESQSTLFIRAFHRADSPL